MTLSKNITKKEIIQQLRESDEIWITPEQAVTLMEGNAASLREELRERPDSLPFDWYRTGRRFHINKDSFLDWVESNKPAEWVAFMRKYHGGEKNDNS